MARATVRQRATTHPVVLTVVASALGYAIVIGTFLGLVPAWLYPDLSITQVNRLADAIAVVNTLATLLLLAGWYWIRHDRVRRHRSAMLGAFGLILVFLVLYLTKVGGGGTKEFVGPTGPYYVYLGMLAIHIILSIVSVPLVLYQVITGLTHTTAQIRGATRHQTVGRIAATAWILSLSLGVIAYLLLNHVYAWEFTAATIAIGL